MNFMSKFILNREGLDKKIVYLIGSAHVKTREGVLGVSELHSNAPVLVLSDKQKKDEQRKIEFNVNQGKDWIHADIHITE
jgi:hypothetical protein